MDQQEANNKQRRLQQGEALAQAQAQARQPQKCPRCDSLNTKFCYYNNYSLSQPRYFCKTCKRYWTQGGTLRNVPVGGGSRKGGKRAARNSSSSSASTSTSAPAGNPSRPRPLPPQDQQVGVTTQEPSPALAPAVAPFYQGGVGGGGYLASPAALNIPALPFDHQTLNVEGSSSYLSLLSGFDLAAAASLGLQNHLHPSLFYQQGTGGSEEGAAAAAAASASHHDWSQSQSLNFMSNAGNRASDAAAMWSTSMTSINGGNSARGGGGGSCSVVVPDECPDVAGYGAPPPPPM